MLARLDTAQGSCAKYDEQKEFRQGQRFALTSLLSTLINEINGKRWYYVATFPSHGKGEVAKFSEGRRLSDEEAYQTFKLIRWGHH